MNIVQQMMLKLTLGFLSKRFFRTHWAKGQQRHSYHNEMQRIVIFMFASPVASLAAVV